MMSRSSPRVTSSLPLPLGVEMVGAIEERVRGEIRGTEECVGVGTLLETEVMFNELMSL